MKFHRLLMSIAVASGMACGAPLAAAREPVRAAVAAVDGVDVEQVATLGAGVPLNFIVFGTAGANVALRIDGAQRVLALRETEPGVYEGSYLIDGLDAIRPESRATATLRKNGAVAYGGLDEPLLLARGTVPWNSAAAPAAGPAALAEASPSPVLEPARPPTGAPLAGTPVPHSRAAESMGSMPIAVTPRQPAPPAAFAAPPAAFAAAPPPPPYGSCSDCAVVESVRAVASAPRDGVIGTIGGAIAGAVLGKELGDAHKRRMLTLLGAIGGALAGRQIERQATQSTQYEVDLRLADGTLLKRRYEQPPPFAAGATIRLDRPMRSAPAPAL